MEFKIAAIEKKLFGDLTLIAPRDELAERPADHEKGFHDDRLKAILENRAEEDIELAQPIIIKDS